MIDDVGSGALGPLFDEPDVRRSVAAGAALVCFSGDKLLGGPQAGLLVGRAAAVEAARTHPLARALRIDKLSLAALEATLRLHRDAPEQIPVLAMLRVAPETLARRAHALAALIPDAEVIEATARVGGGALPLLELPGPGSSPSSGDPPRSRRAAAAADPRATRPSLLGRVERGRLLLDPRTPHRRLRRAAPPAAEAVRASSLGGG